MMLDTDPPLPGPPEARPDPPTEISAGRDGADDWSEPSSEPTWWQRQEPWCAGALFAGVVGAVPFTWAVPLLSLVAVAAALVGIRRCQLDASWPNRWMAVLGLVLGLMALVAAVVGTALGRVEFLPFWTDQ